MTTIPGMRATLKIVKKAMETEKPAGQVLWRRCYENGLEPGPNGYKQEKPTLVKPNRSMAKMTRYLLTADALDWQLHARYPTQVGDH